MWLTLCAHRLIAIGHHARPQPPWMNARPRGKSACCSKIIDLMRSLRVEPFQTPRAKSPGHRSLQFRPRQGLTPGRVSSIPAT